MNKLIMLIIILQIQVLIYGQSTEKEVRFKITYSGIGKEIPSYSEDILKLSGDSVFILASSYYFDKSKTSICEKYVDKGRWEISRDTLILYDKQGVEFKNKFLIRKNKLLEISIYYKTARNYRKSNKPHYKLLRWKRITPVKKSLILELN